MGERMTEGTQGPATRVVLLPDLEHCIQTRARQEYTAAMNQALSGSHTPGIERRLELLKAFLEEADFGRLRRESELHLMQGRRVMLVLSGSGEPGQWKAEMNVEGQA